MPYRPAARIEDSIACEMSVSRPGRDARDCGPRKLRSSRFALPEATPRPAAAMPAHIASAATRASLPTSRRTSPDCGAVLDGWHGDAVERDEVTLPQHL